MGHRGREQRLLLFVLAALFAVTVILFVAKLPPVFHAVGRGLTG